ncbi:MAG: T9SS type A sorting domain-containing protein [Bacteroidales bacterium]|nr:T9SS type A sorting domain-containing protein [Bacteroidales bacterium]
MIRFLFIVCIILLVRIYIYGADFYAFQSGNYTSAGIWRIGSCTGPLAGSAPSATDNVFICANVDVTVSSNITCANLFIWGSLSISGNRTINVTGNLTLYNAAVLGGDNNNATFNVAGNFNFHDGATIDGAQPFNLRITGSMNNISDAGPLQARVGKVDIWVEGMTFINGDFIFTITGQGTKRFNGGITVNSTGTFDNTVGEDPFVNGNIINNGSWIGCTGGNCVYALGNIAGRIINIMGSNPIQLSTIRIPQATSVVNNYATVILDRTANDNTLIRENGTFNNYGVLYLGRGTDVSVEPSVTFRASFPGNTVHYYKNGNQQIRIPNDGSYYNLVVASSGTKTLQTPGGTLTVTNYLKIEDNAILQIGATETLNGTGALEMTDNSVLRILKCSGPAQPELTGTYNLIGGTIELAGNCNQTYNSVPLKSDTLFNLTLSGSGTKTISGIKHFNGNITISGNAVLGSYTYFTQRCDAYFIYSSNANSTLSNNMQIGNFEMTTGITGTLNASTYTITTCGDIMRFNGGTFNPSTSTVIFDGATSIEGSLSPAFNHININAGKKLYSHINKITVRGNFTNHGEFYHRNGTVEFDNNSTIFGTSITTFNHLTITANGTLTSHSLQVNIEGNFTNNRTFNHNNGTVAFIGSNSATISGSTVTTTFYRMIINKTSTSVIVTQISSNVTVTNLMEINNGTYNVGTNTLSGAGGLTMTGGELQIAKLATVPELVGSYSITGGTVTLNGAGNQTLRTSTTGGSTYNNLIFTGSGNKVITGLLTINGDMTVSSTAFISVVSAFTQNASKTFYYTSSQTSTIGNSITIGNFYQDNGTISVNTNFNIIVKGNNFYKTGSGILTLNGTARLIFSGSDTQYFFDNSSSPILTNVTLNNSSGLILNSDIQISTNLNLLNGVLTTQSNEVFMTNNTHTINRTNGFINGWLECNLPSGTYSREYPIGCNTDDYTPIIINFTSATSGGNLKIGAFEPDHPDIFASNIDPNKTVNVYWKILNTISGTKELTFNYPSSSVDMEAVVEEFFVGKYNIPDFSQLTPSSTPTNTQTKISGLDVLTGDYIIGNKYNPEFVYTARTGSINWNDRKNWIQYRTGVISCSTTSNIVTGISTLFTSELSVGDEIALQSSPQDPIGVVQSIVNNNTLILTTNAAASVTNASYGKKKIPELNDIVNIGNNLLSSANVTVTLDVDAEIHQLNFTAMGRSNTLTHQDNKNLFVRTNVNLQVPSAATNTNTWNINNGSANVQGNVIIGRGGTTNRSATLNIINGRLVVGTNLVFNSSSPASSATLNITGSGRIDLGSSFILSNSGNNFGTFNPGTNSIFCYCSSGNPQTANFNITAPAVNYANLHFGNTSPSGATIPSSITSTRVTGNLVVESGLFYYGSTLSATGNAGKIFNVKSGATFRLLNTATFPTVYTYNLENGSIVEVKTTTSTNLPTTTYGFLYVIPEANGVLPRFNTAGTVQVLNDLIIGNGTNSMTFDLYSWDPNLTVMGNVYINPNATFGFSDLPRNIDLYGHWINNGGTVNTNLTQSTVRFVGSINQEITGTVTSQSFPNIEINKPSGNISVTGSINTLNINALTVTKGNFLMPLYLNLTNSTSAHLTINTEGILSDNNSTINIHGNWINNGGVFNYGNSTVIFGLNAIQTIQGVSPQVFNNIEINKTGNYVQQNIAELNVKNFKQLNRTYQAQNANSILRVNGNFELSGNAAFNGTNILHLYIGGNVLHNSTGAWTMSTNVYLTGTAQQTISGTSALPAFTNLIINNSSINDAIITNKPLLVNGILTLRQGQLVTTMTNILEIGSSGTIVLDAPGGNQTLSFVKGPMIHNVNTNILVTKIFPVGRGNIYHRIDLNIRQVSNTNTKYTGQYFNSSASSLGWSLPPSIKRVSNVGHWEIDKGSGANVATASVTLYFDSVYDQIDDYTSLRIAKGNPSTWTDIGGSVSGTTITSTVNFTSFSKFSLASTQLSTNPLPINLVSFRGECKQNNVWLYWTTASETNNDYFEIERSENGYEFSSIGKIDGAGNSNYWIDYAFNDSTATFTYYPFLYYKLKQVDFDEQYSYSETIAVNKCHDVNHEFNYIRIGNSENYLTIIFNEPVNEEILINILDANGKTVKRLHYKMNNQTTAIISKNDLASGTYTISIKSESKQYATKVVIIK